MSKHWTERSVKDFLHRIASDFILQLEKKMDSLPMTQIELAKELNISEGRVSQILNNPGNLTLAKIVEYSRALGLKVAIVAYENNDGNGGVPVNSEIFSICWERQGKPADFFSLKESVVEVGDEFALLGVEQTATHAETIFSPKNDVVRDFNIYKEAKATQANNLDLGIPQAA